MLSIRGRMPEFVLVASTLLTMQAHARVPLTLAEAEDLALAAEPGQRALLAESDALQEQSVAAGQLPDPTLRIGLINFPISDGSFSTEGMTQAQLGFRQEFTRGRTRALRTARLRSLADEKTASAAARERNVLDATRTAWLEAYYWQRARQIVVDSRPFFADLVNVTRSLYAVGRKTQHDVLRAELELSRLDDRLIENDRSLAAARARLSRWIGNDAYRPIAMKLPTWPALPDRADLLLMLEDHPRFGEADAQIAASQSDVDLANDSYRPGWALDVAYGYREGSLPSGEPRSDFLSVVVTVDLPLFGENRQGRRLAAALSERRAAVAVRQALQAELSSDLDAEYARWNDLSRRLALYETRILQQSDGQAQAALLAYQSDAGDFSDVMRGYIDNLNTRLEHIRLQVERAESYAALANLGGLAR